MSDAVVNEARQKICNTIAALLAKANDESCTEAEAALFADKAQELLAKHQIEMGELGAAKDPMIRDNDLLTDRAAWIKPLLGAVSKLYFCGYYYETFPADWVKRNGFDKNSRKLKGGGHGRVFLRHNFIGERVNIIVAKNMAEYLISSMEKLCTEGEKSIHKDERTSYRYSFMNACASRLCFRLLKRRTETSAVGDVKTNLPALRSMYENAQDAFKQWCEDQNTKLVTKKSLARVNHAGGARAGSQAGDRIGLDDQIGDKTAGKRISHLRVVA